MCSMGMTTPRRLRHSRCRTTPVFLPSTHKDFNHESGFLNALSTARLLLQSNLSSGFSSKYSFTSWLWCTQLLGPARLCDVNRTHQAPPPCGTSASSETVGLVVSRVVVVQWPRCGELPTASLADQARGVLWALTGTLPCNTTTQAGWWSYQSASSSARCACAGVVEHVVVPGRGGFCDIVLSGFRKNQKNEKILKKKKFTEVCAVSVHSVSRQMI